MNKKHYRTAYSLIALVALGLAISGCTMANELASVNKSDVMAENNQDVSAAQVNNDLTEFDLSNNGRIDDDEFFRVIDLWVEEDVSNQMFFEVIDAWTSQAELGVIVQKSQEPDKSRIHVYRGIVPAGGLYIIGMPGAVEAEANVIVRDEMGNTAMAIAEWDGSFRFSSFDLPDGFDHTLGGRIDVTQKYDGRHYSNPITIVIQFN